MVNENGLSNQAPASLSDDWIEPPFNPDETNDQAQITNPSNNEEQAPKVITISKDKLGEEIERLFNEDSDFAREFSIRVGNKARERYHPQIEEWKQKHDNLLRQIEAERITAIPEAELAEKLKDPDFARKYADAKSFQPTEQEQAVNPAQELLNFWITEAQTKGFTDDDIRTIVKNIGEGKYEFDEFGNKLTSPSEWREGMKVLKRDIDSIVAERVAVSSTTPTAQQNENNNSQQPVTPPANRDSSGPDISNPGSRGNGPATYSFEQYRAMNIEERQRLWPTQADEDRAFASGQIKMPDFS